jgi:Ribbon-helix-helix domain
MKTKRKVTGFHATSVDITDQQYEALKSISDATRLSLAVQIRAAIDAYLKKQAVTK